MRAIRQRDIPAGIHRDWTCRAPIEYTVVRRDLAEGGDHHRTRGQGGLIGSVAIGREGAARFHGLWQHRHISICRRDETPEGKAVQGA